MWFKGWGIVFLNVSWMKKNVLEGPLSISIWSKFFLRYLSYDDFQSLSPFLKQECHLSHQITSTSKSFEDPRVNIFYAFSKLFVILLYLSCSQQRKPTSTGLHKRSLIKSRQGSLPERTSRVFQFLNCSYGTTCQLRHIAFTGFLDGEVLCNHRQPQVPKSFRTVLSVYWQRYWIF